MATLSKRSPRLVVLILFGLLVGTLTFVQLRAKRLAQISPLGRPIPTQGLDWNNTKGQVPGNPQDTVGRMQRIYALLKIYMAKHEGQYPHQFGMEVTQNPTEYGLPDPHGPGCNDTCFYNRMKSNFSLFTSPDAIYSDLPTTAEEAEHTSVFLMADTRPDGSKVGGPKSPGTRDVFISTDIYVHQNVRLYPHERSTSNPVGFYLVLWDDGQVEKIPYDKIVYVPANGHDFHFGFPGQAGVPNNSLNYDAFYKQHNKNAVPPRGGPGLPGRDYKGETL